MQKKPLISLPIKRRFLKVASKTAFWSLIVRNGWCIKFSVYDGDNILMFFISSYTGQTIIRYFVDENEACDYINYICYQDPTKLLDFTDENPA